MDARHGHCLVSINRKSENLLLSLLTRLIGHLSVGRKLILIYALDLTAVIFVSGILINEKFIAIDFARKEIVGNAYINVVRDALFAVPKEIAIRKPTAGEVRTAEARYGAAMGCRLLAEDFASRLETNSTGGVKPVMQAGHSLITRIGNQSNLILDPDLDSYYTMSLIVLRFPELVQLIESIRAKSAEKDRAPPGGYDRIQTEYLILEGQLDATVKGIGADYAEAVAAGKPDFRHQMTAARDRLLAEINVFRDGAHRAINEPLHQADSPDIDRAAQSLLSQLEASWEQAGDTLDGLLDQRLDHLFKRMWIHLGTAASLLLLILSVVYFVARQIALPVRRLAGVADQVRATGNYQLRAHWDSGDELGRLVNGFNSMLEQLNRSRLIEQEMAASTRAAAAQKELLEAIPIPLMVTSIPRHNVLHCNEPAQQWLHGRTTDPWQPGLLTPARLRFFQQLADRDAVDEFEVLWQGSDSQNWALISARRLRYQDQDAVLTTFTPINSLKQMEQRLKL